jgi:type I restriction enzyme M protein
MHGVHYADFNIKREDTLEFPQHSEMHFDAIVANPPFSANWSADPLFMSDDRFSQYGKLAPKTKADFAFVQHIVYHLAEDGTAAIVMPHGVLFRGGAEGQIRQYLIEKLNCLDAVIGLPANIFYGTTIPTCVLVLKKCRKHADDVLFIDASQGFDKVKTQNVLRPEHIDKIIASYKARSNEDKYSRVASMADIASNDYNLNIPRYVDTFEAQGTVDLSEISEKLVSLELESKETDSLIAGFCKELGIDPPFANVGVAS